MEAALGSDPVKIMIQDIQMLSNMHENPPEDIEAKQIYALDEISHYCEDLDLANDFQKIGGYALLPKLLFNASSEVRWRCADLIAILVQNNPYCQKAAVNLDLMRLLIEVLNTDSHNEVRIKALYAISCLSRECEEGQEAFTKHNGLSALIKAMQSDVQKLQMKSAFLVSYLSQTSDKLKKSLTDSGIIRQLSVLLQSPHAAHHEYIMSALVYIVTDNAQALNYCKQPDLQLQLILSEKLKILAGKEEHMEEEESVRKLLQMCLSGGKSL